MKTKKRRGKGTNVKKHYLSRDGNNGGAVEQGISKAADQVGGARPRGSYANTRKPRGPGVAFSSEYAALLMPGQHVLDGL